MIVVVIVIVIVVVNVSVIVVIVVILVVQFVAMNFVKDVVLLFVIFNNNITLDKFFFIKNKNILYFLKIFIEKYN